jgi:hypothetical protein
VTSPLLGYFTHTPTKFCLHTWIDGQVIYGGTRDSPYFYMPTNYTIDGTGDSGARRICSFAHAAGAFDKCFGGDGSATRSAAFHDTYRRLNSSGSMNLLLLQVQGGWRMGG